MITKTFYGLAMLYFTSYIDCDREAEEDFKYRDTFSKIGCYKHKSCTPGGPKVCGYDEKSSVLAYFGDLCTLHEANCKKAGFYTKVDLIVCDVKKNYTLTFKDELQFEKILRNTVAPTTVPNKDDPSAKSLERDSNGKVDETVIRSGNNTKGLTYFDGKGLGLIQLVKGEKK